MNKEMKITGAAPQIASLTFLYLFITVLIDFMAKDAFKISYNHYTALSIIAVIMIIIGAVIVAVSARKLRSSFQKGILMRDGLYRIVRNPMYAAYIFFIIPGICLLFNSWLVLTTIAANVVLTVLLVKKEYKYLEQKFGEEYKDYLKTVLIKFI
jgi:protein-S-isoprenylcysteine O-methyltransferase Ste14